MTITNPNETFYFASCPVGSEELLMKELNAQNIEGKLSRGGVLFKATAPGAIEFALRSRLASRVHKEVGYFYIKNEKDIYKNAVKINWSEFIKPTNSFKISTLLDREANQFFKNSIYLSQLLKDALVDNQRQNFNQRSNVETVNADINFLQRIEMGKTDYLVRIFSDLTGVSLDKRGYRDQKHRAPLRENLAAALVLSTSWNPETEVFFDPMVGSGTILMEAIMIKAGISPSILNLRNNTRFSFTKQDWFLNSATANWYREFKEKLMKENNDAIAALKPGSFFANDIDANNIKITVTHLRNLFGRADIVEFSAENFLTMKNPLPANGVILFNPPYGERLEVDEELNQFYHDIGEVLKNNYQGNTAYIFTLHGDLKKNIRLKTTKKIPFFNGDLDCRLFEYKLS